MIFQRLNNDHLFSHKIQRNRTCVTNYDELKKIGIG